MMMQAIELGDHEEVRRLRLQSNEPLTAMRIQISSQLSTSVGCMNNIFHIINNEFTYSGSYGNKNGNKVTCKRFQ